MLDRIAEERKSADRLRAEQRKYKNSVTESVGSYEEIHINHPAHYTKGIETTDYILSWDMNFVEGNIIKYVSRYKYKDGVEDLKKAHWYLTKLIADCEKSQSDPIQKSQSNPIQKSQSNEKPVKLNLTSSV